MKVTIANEMPAEQRCDELLLGLAGTGAEPVFVNFSHIAQVLGMQEAEKYVEPFTEMREAINANLNPHSTLKETNRRGGLCQVNRAAVYEACLKVKESRNKKKIDDKVQAPKP